MSPPVLVNALDLFFCSSTTSRRIPEIGSTLCHWTCTSFQKNPRLADLWLVTRCSHLHSIHSSALCQRRRQPKPSQYPHTVLDSFFGFTTMCQIQSPPKFFFLNSSLNCPVLPLKDGITWHQTTPSQNLSKMTAGSTNATYTKLPFSLHTTWTVAQYFTFQGQQSHPFVCFLKHHTVQQF